jgi:ATP-binding cassette subfamily F protein uup
MSRPKEKVKPASKPLEKTEREAPKKRKLLNKEREALKELPKQIERMEAERDRITASMQEPDYYRNAENDPLGDQQKLEELENEILESYEAWEELTELSES